MVEYPTFFGKGDDKKFYMKTLIKYLTQFLRDLSYRFVLHALHFRISEFHFFAKVKITI